MTTLATAYHEAGHAVLSYALGLGVREVIVRPDGSGEFIPPDNAKALPSSVELAIADAVVCAAGPAADQKFCKSRGVGYRCNSADIDLEIIQFGAECIDRDHRALLTLGWRLAIRAVDDPTIWRAIEALADKLDQLACPTLGGAEVREILRDAEVYPGFFGWSAREDPDAADEAEEAARKAKAEAAEASEAAMDAVIAALGEYAFEPEPGGEWAPVDPTVAF